jgi:hypothetical protein
LGFPKRMSARLRRTQNRIIVSVCYKTNMAHTHSKVRWGPTSSKEQQLGTSSCSGHLEVSCWYGNGKMASALPMHHQYMTSLLQLNMAEAKQIQKRKRQSAKRQKNNTRDSNVVPHRSTNLARQCLTSLSRREAVLSLWYGRSWRERRI